MIRGITEVNLPSYATLHQATVSFQDMGDRTITSQVRIDGNIVPSFVGTDGKDWTLMFRGQKFIMPIRKPQASKGDRSESVVDLTFQHWAIHELKRYYFVQMAVTEAGTAVADKYEASLAVTLPEFVDALNQVLNYWTGGKIVADFYDTVYDLTKSYVDINYSHIWEVVQKIYEVFSVRWYLDYNAQTDVYTIKINYPATELTHEFEYGFEGGLLKFERNVQSTDITNILLGRGGERNLPAYYFKQAPLGSLFASDPDACPELANVYFENLRGKSFRDYVKGWNFAHHKGEPMQNPTWAYTKGATDETFNPVEFVKNDESIDLYGELWGAIENKEDIYPSIQGVEISPYGRIDEVVAVEEVTTDDIESAADASAVVTNLDGTKSLSRDIPLGESTHTIKGGSFTVPDGLTGRLSWSWFKEFTGNSYNPAANVYVDTNPAHSYIKVYNSTGKEVSSQAIPAGMGYRWEITIRMMNNNDEYMYGTFGAQEMKLTTSNTDSAAWKPTFDIWVKNIWNTTKQAGETDDDYVERVWLPILGDRAGNEAAVVFSDGWLAQSTDWEFVILGNIFAGIHYDTSKTYNGVRSEWRITLQKTDAELEATGLYIPNARTNGNAVAGNHFFFIGIDMPYQYVTWAEEKLDNFKNGQLDDTADINPTWAVTLDKVRIEQDDSEGASTFKIIDRLDAGTLVNIKDKRYTYNPETGTVDTLQLYLQTVNITWQEGKIIPDVEVVLSDTVAVVLSPMEKLEGEVSVLKANAVEMSNIEAVINKIANVSFLKKTGETQKSYSPTSFASLIQSTDFRQGDIGGRGWGLYRSNALPDSDEHSDYAGDESEHPSETHKRATLEVDELTVRHTMRVNQLVVNQISYEGGKQIISAAGMECSEAYADRIVVSGAYKNVYICHFNQKRGSVANLFQVGDIALGQVFSASNVEVKYYRRRVVACGEDYIALSNEAGEYTGDGVPSAGDVIVQYGSYTNPERRYAIIRDVIGGGYERMISGLSDVNSAGVEYYFAGQQTGTGMRWFIGDDGQYARWTPNGGLEIAGKITVKAGSVGLTEFEEYETLQNTIDALEDNMIDVKQALFNINADTVLDDSEKSHLRTIWEQMNGLDSLTEVGAGGSYLSTVALLEELQYQGETVTLSFRGQEILFNGNAIQFHYIGVSDFTMAFYNVREYLTRMKLYEGGPVPNFERAYLAELLTKYNKLQEDLLAKAQKRYADVTAGAQIEEFIEGEYAQDIADIYEQMDKKAETWVQDTDPAAEWTTATLKHEHIGDLWWNTNNVEVSGVGAGASAVYRYNNTTRVYEWKETTVPLEIFDKIDGKSSIYIAKPTKYKLGDMWVLNGDYTVNGVVYKRGDLLTATQDSETFNEAHWLKRVRYTDDTAIDELEIGGRNLARLTNSKEWGIYLGGTISFGEYKGITTIKSTDNGSGYISIQQGPNARKMLLRAGEQYIISLLVRGTVPLAYNYIMNSGTSNNHIGDFTYEQPLNEETFVKAFAKVTGTAAFELSTGSYFMTRPTVINEGDWVEITQLKIEKGNKATDWTPAPEDVEANIETAKTEAESAAQAYADIKAEAERGLAEAYADGIVTDEEVRAIADVNAKLEAAKAYADAQDAVLKTQQEAYADGAISTAEQAAIQAAKDYADLKKTEAEAYADGIVSDEEARAIADAQAKYEAAKAHAEQIVDNLEIGGRNLVLDSLNRIILRSNSSSIVPNQDQAVSGENYRRFRRTYPEGITDNRISTYTDEFFTPEKSGYYTYSIYFRPNEFDIELRLQFGDSYGNFTLCKANEWTQISVTAWIEAGVATRLFGVWGVMPPEVVQWIDYNRVSVTSGNKATDWTPAPEDVQAEIDAEKNRINDILSDNIADPSEKQYLSNLWQEIGAEYPRIRAQANTYAVDKTTYEQKYTALKNILDPVLANLTINSTVSGSSIRTAFSQYYDARTVLQNAITDKANQNAADADAKAQALDYLKQAIGQDTEINGALVTLVTMLLKEDMDADVTAGISGLQGVAKNLPAFWAGGTDVQAQQGTAKAIIRHDGTAKFTDAEITGSVNATSGNIASLIIEQNRLLSGSRRIEIDGVNSIIALKDANLKIKTIIHPDDIPSIEDYFETGVIGKVLSALNSNHFTGTNAVSLTIGGSSSETHELTIGGFDIETHLSISMGSGDPDEYAEAVTFVELVKDGVVMLILAEAIAGSYADVGGAVAYGGMQSRTFTVPGNATYSVRVVHSIQQPPGNATATSFAKIIGMTTMAASRVVNRSEIGNNGMVIATSSLNYTYDVGGLFQVRRGNIGFQITSAGIKKSSNMSSPTPTWTNI